MWDEADRRTPSGPIPSRERDDRKDDRRDDRRKYRSRSPRRDDRRGGNRDRGGRKDDRESRNEGKGSRRDDGHRDRDGPRDRGMYAPAEIDSFALPYRHKSDTVACEDWRAGRDKTKEGKRDRSRSPRREKNREERRDGERYLKREDREKSRSLLPEDIPTKSRTATPPVSFKVGAPAAQDHDRMEIEPSRKGKDKAVEQTVEEDDEDDEIVVVDDGMAEMQAMMGFGGFSTTQNRQILGNNISAVRKEKKTEYRQYMNRVGGFNRPLSPTRDE
jgi:U4/U6.U5 tri-snRNP-associated protein 3